MRLGKLFSLLLSGFLCSKVVFMPIISLCDGCGIKLGVFGKNTLSGQRLKYRVFCNSCIKAIENYAIRKYKIKIEEDHEI